MHNLWKNKRKIPLGTSRGLKWENKTYKLKRSIAKTAFITARIIASLEIMIAKYKAVRTYNEEHGPQRRNTRSFFRESSSHHLVMCPLNEEKVVKEWNILSFVVFVIYKAPIFFFCKLKRWCLFVTLFVGIFSLALLLWMWKIQVCHKSLRKNTTLVNPTLVNHNQSQTITTLVFDPSQRTQPCSSK